MVSDDLKEALNKILELEERLVILEELLLEKCDKCGSALPFAQVPITPTKNLLCAKCHLEILKEYGFTE